MSIQSWQTNTTQDHENLLQGYDPVRERYQWHLLLAGCLVSIAIVSYIMSPGINNSTVLFLPGMSIIVLLSLAVGIMLACFGTWLIRCYRGDLRYKARLRRAALDFQPLPQLSIQPKPFPGWSLPLRIEHRLQKSLALLIAIEVCFVLGYVFINYSVYDHLFGWVYAPMALGILPFLGFMYIGMCIYIVLVNRAIKMYLLPQLQVDDAGITARYGRYTIPMRWQEIRYFALTSVVPTARKTSQKTEIAFEISDGQNIICWQASTLSRWYPLFLNGEQRLSPQNYALLTQQIAALIAERTGLPMYDFRGLERKSKRGDSGFGKREAR